MEYDILIVGAGPAGLGAAIRAKQIAMEQDKEINVCVVEKGSEVGAHILSGNIFEPTAFNELFPDWKQLDEDARPPLTTPVNDEAVYWLPNEKRSFKIPNMFLPPEQHNHGNYIISLGDLCRWMGERAEELGVEIFPGFAADSPVVDENNVVKGIQLKDVGIAKDGEKKDGMFEPGMQLLGKQTILTEGCRGSVSMRVMDKYNLNEGKCPQHYGLGIKEVWEVDNANPGFVMHSVGWPLDHFTYGGSFVYHQEPNLIHIGLITGLDYKNPHISPYQEFQRFKHHPVIAKQLEGGKCISYGARCVNEGGFQAIPKMTFPGGMLAGCSAGFLNMPKIKGSHTAMKTGMLAGEAAAEQILAENPKDEFTQYEDKVKSSWVWEELKRGRNVKPSFKAGLLAGMAYTGTSLHVFRGKEPWTFRWTKKDHQYTKPAADCKKIVYPKPDGKLSFEILDNLIKSGVNHEHDQPAHLKVKEDKLSVPLSLSLDVYDGPEQRFCPAKVYEYVNDDENPGKQRLQINAQNCVHCKCCSIKTPSEYINWTVPEGAGGPQYSGM